MFIGNFSLHAYLFEGIGIPGTRIAVFNYHVGAGNWTQILWLSSQSS